MEGGLVTVPADEIAALERVIDTLALLLGAGVTVPMVHIDADTGHALLRLYGRLRRATPEQPQSLP